MGEVFWKENILESGNLTETNRKNRGQNKPYFIEIEIGYICRLG
jgi:hypothetical protein